VSLIDRYVFREALWSWLTVLSVLFVIFMSNQFAEILSQAASNELPKEAVFAVFWLTSLRYLTILAPIALFLGVMLALARFSRDSEMAAFLACGVGPGKLLLPITILTLLLVAASSWLSLFATPQATLRIEALKYDAEAELELGALEPGRFASPDSGNSVFHAERVEGEQIYGVFWQREVEGRVVVILAERGERKRDPSTGMLSFVLYNGTRYEGLPGALDFSIVEFTEHGIPIREQQRDEFVPGPELKTTAALSESSDPLDRAELQWRLSSPLSLLVLAVLAVPLSRSSPREGKYGRLGLGILIYIVYANLISAAKIWVEREQVPPWLGIWWVHAGVALIAVALLARESGWLVRPRRIVSANAGTP